MSDRTTLAALLQALSQTRPDATVSDFDQAARPEVYAVPMDRRPATMRAPTYAERLRGLLESGARTVTDQPVGRILDILLSGGGVRAMADAQSPPLVSMGEASKPTQKTLAAEVAKRVPNPIKAYHGSPHDFDQFSMEKIGTGEGAQAYGHGLYFAQREGTAKGYRDALAPQYLKTATGDRIDVVDEDAVIDVLSQHPRNVALSRQARSVKIAPDTASIATDALVETQGNIAAAVKALRDKAAREPERLVGTYVPRDVAREIGTHYTTAADLLEQSGLSLQREKGHLYEVAIHADPESFLDWDKPLSQQSEAVRKALTKAAREREFDAFDNPALAAVATGKHPRGVPYDPTVQDVLPDLASVMGVHGNGPEISQAFKSQGIPGIKYLDQGSRAAGEGSRNYVVFDDSLIEILRKYGLLPFAAGLGTAGKDQR